LALFLPGIAVLDLWDLSEMRLAEAAREMIITEEFYKLQVNFKPNWDMGPLPVWWQALGMQYFGINEIGVRLPNALLACLAMLSVFLIGRILHGSEFGFIWSLLAFCPIGIHALLRTGMVEPVYGFFLFVTIACVAFAADKKQRGGSSLEAALAGLFLGLAVLADGISALALLGVLFLVVWISNGGRPLMVASDVVILALAVGMTTMLWFGYEWAVNGPAFLEGFLQAPNWRIGEDATGRTPTLVGRVAILLFGLFPTSWIAVPTLLRYREKDPADFRMWMLILFWLCLFVLLLLPDMALMAMSTAVYPLGYLATLHLSQPVRRIVQRVPGLWTGMASVFFIVGVSSLFFPMLMASKAPWLVDKLRNHGYIPVNHWSGYEGLAGLILIIIVIPVFRLGKAHKHTPASLVVTLGMMAYFALSYPFLGKGIQDLTQGGYPRLFAKASPGKGYAAAITFTSYAPLFYGQRSVNMLCNSLPDSCFLLQRVPVPVYKVVPVWSFGSGKHLAGFEEVDRAGAYVLFRKFNKRPGH
jgi:hypothetical protein